jgi:hypothetical protein
MQANVQDDPSYAVPAGAGPTAGRQPAEPVVAVLGPGCLGREVVRACARW